jgi:polyhydroxyalkanoate synthase subunit PhaE
MPVRSEVDEMHKNIYELRKEVKTLKKSLAKYEALFEKLNQPPV